MVFFFFLKDKQLFSHIKRTKNERIILLARCFVMISQKQFITGWRKRKHRFKFSMHRATLEQHLLGTLKEQRLEGKLSLGDQSV